MHTRRVWVGQAVEVLSSMRFAISMLTILAIASVIGTVLTQNEPVTNYVNQFGPFWFEVFAKLSLYTVYSAWWFLLIMGFLVLSTSLCIVRNAPKMLRDTRSWRENVRERSLRNFPHKVEWTLPMPLTESAARLAHIIGASGYKVKVVDKEQARLVTAKQGAANRWGYIFSHSAIVIICLGGLLDSDLPIRYQLWFGGKTPFAGSGIIAQIPEEHRLSVANPSFRGNTLIPEGASSNTAIIPQQAGVMVQDLPFTILLKKFIIEHYSNGMPKLFASEVVLTDHQSGERVEATIKVNEPLIHKGVALYQASFEDGGSRLKVAAYPMQGAQPKTFALDGEVGRSTMLDNSQGGEYTVEWSDFRPFNVENMVEANTDVRAVDTRKTFNQNVSEGLSRQMGSAGKNAHNKDLKNVGPSFQYKLRDANGQAREYHNYMLPVDADGNQVFLAGMRDSPNDTFRYLRIPADDAHSVQEWMRLRAALQNPALRAKAAQAYAQHAVPGSAGMSELRQQLQQSAARGLAIFAGNEEEAGYVAISNFIARVPQEEQEKAAEIFMKILNGSLWELWQVARVEESLTPMEQTAENGRFLQLATNALADSFFYGAPVYLQLQSFEEVKASVLQVTRSPGQNVVYLGCLFLVIGVFSMLYIRERRLWIWLKPEADGQTRALMAMSTQRRTLDFEREFEKMKQRLVPQPPAT